MISHTSRIYVAGHTGLLGSALVKRLTSGGYTNIITRTRQLLDLTDKNQVDDFFKAERPEYVFLAAGKVGGIIGNKTYPADYFYINNAIQNNVFSASQQYDVMNIVFYGSSCTYPRDSYQPIKESYFLTGQIEETSEGYAAAKIAGIIGCRSYNKQYKKNRFIALIPNSMYGPHDNFDLENSHVLSSIMRKLHDAKEHNLDNVVLWGSGNPRREFIFSEDVADASIFMVKNAERLENRHYNVGVGVDYSIRELAETISDVVGYKGKITWDTSKPDGAPRKLLDSTDLIKMGWNHKTEFREGLDKTYNWYKSNFI